MLLERTPKNENEHIDPDIRGALDSVRHHDADSITCSYVGADTVPHS